MAVFPELTSDNDWVLGAFATGEKAILLDVTTACQEWLRNCWWNQNAGVDWEAILGGGDTKQLLKQQLTQVIINRQGVSEITNLTISLENYKAMVNVSFKTIYESELSFAISNG
jgi:hypothetical protein